MRLRFCRDLGRAGVDDGGMSKIAAVQIDDELAAELERLAQRPSSDRSELDEQALRSRVTSERDFLAKVDAGLADLAAGRVKDHGTVVAAVRRIYRPAR